MEHNLSHGVTRLSISNLIVLSLNSFTLNLYDKMISFHVSFKHERFKEFHDRELCTSCGKYSIEILRKRCYLWTSHPRASPPSP